tara:strand:+ start:440 stop:634 length:195 start_codon:yes stop_codon:yes gene_type:complete
LTAHSTIGCVVRAHKNWLLSTSVCFDEVSSGVLLVFKIWFAWTLDHGEDGSGVGDFTIGSGSGT